MYAPKTGFYFLKSQIWDIYFYICLVLAYKRTAHTVGNLMSPWTLWVLETWIDCLWNILIYPNFGRHLRRFWANFYHLETLEKEFQNSDYQLTSLFHPYFKIRQGLHLIISLLSACIISPRCLSIHRDILGVIASHFRITEFSIC